MGDKSRQSLLEIHAAVALFGLAGLFGKWIPLPPVLIVLGRVFFASLALGTILLLMKLRLREIVGEALFLLALLGAVLSVHWVAFFQAIRVSSVAVGLLSYSCFPVFTVILEPILFREKMDRLNLGLAGMCLFGVFLIVPRFDATDLIFQGVLWGLFSGLTFAVLTLFNRRLAQRHSSLAVAFFEDLFATLFLWPFFLVFRAPLSVSSLLLLIGLGIVCTALSHTLFIKGMRFVRAQTASIISSLEPVYGIVLAFFLLREVPSWRTLSGGAVILGSVILVSVRESSRKSERR
jgi:drug/metabolite transporter (DMT)-like permease